MMIMKLDYIFAPVFLFFVLWKVELKISVSLYIFSGSRTIPSKEYCPPTLKLTTTLTLTEG